MQTAQQRWLMVASFSAMTAATPALAQEMGSAGNDEIIVTGQKIERSIQDTPVSVGVTTALEFEEENLIDLNDVIERTANVTTLGGSSFTIRGINARNVSGGGSSDLATIYVDGSPLPRFAGNAGAQDVWDIEQIEIYRGPQSTLQGRASLAGAILINTADPTFEWSGRARAIYTTKEDEFRIGGAISGPIVEDQVAIRLAAEHSESDGFGRNITRDEPLNAQNNLLARGKILIEPAKVPGLVILLSYTRDEKESGEELVRLNTPDPENDRIGTSNDPIRYQTDINIMTGTLNYDFNDRLSLTSITGYNEVDYNFLFDDDRSAADQSERSFVTEINTFTQEARLQYDGSVLDAVGGFYYSNEDTPISQSDGTLILEPVADLGLPNRLLELGVPAQLVPAIVFLYPEQILINNDGGITQDIETFALFADVTWNFADRWTLFAGARYDRETQTGTTETNITIQTPLPDPVLGAQALVDAGILPPDPATIGLVQFIVGTANDLFRADALSATSPLTPYESDTFGGFLPKIGLGYDLDETKSLSFTIQRGYRSGGVAINSARATPFEFDQEFIWNYELALRSTWLDDALTVNANAFYLDWTDQQISVQLSDNVFDTQVVNAGKSSVRGLEIEAQYAASESLDIYGSVGFNETEFEEFIIGVNSAGAATLPNCTANPDVGPTFFCDFAGNEFSFAPKLTLNGGVTWRPFENYIANVNANHASAAFIRGDRPQTSRDSEARTLVNFRTGWDNGQWGIFVTGQNVLNEEYLISQFPNDPLTNATPEFGRFGNPRTFSVQFETRF